MPHAQGGKCCSADGSGTGTLGRNARAQKGNAPFETLSTCLALIEIVNSCNLSCPTCYADSPLGLRGAVDAVPLTDLQNRIQSVIDRKGKIEILQLSGGEPTLHPEFFDLVRWAQAHPGIDYLLLNTNGLRIARDDAFLEELGRTFHRGGMQLYLQFDGPREAGQKELRGADLRAMRAKGWEVTELPRDTEITIHQLTGFDLVIRPPAFFPYSEAEANWENVRGARQYQIVVLGASAHIPMFNSTTHDSEVSIPQQQSTIAGHNLNGWTWQVRAQDHDGQWGDWSASRTFDVLPMKRGMTSNE